MQRKFLSIMLLVCALSLFAACSKSGAREAAESQALQTSTPNDSVRRVSIEEVRAAIEKNDVVVVDVRGSVEYKLGHIKGARSIPLGLVKEQAKDLPKDKLIVFYCA